LLPDGPEPFVQDLEGLRFARTLEAIPLEAPPKFCGLCLDGLEVGPGAFPEFDRNGKLIGLRLEPPELRLRSLDRAIQGTDAPLDAPDLLRERRVLFALRPVLNEVVFHHPGSLYHSSTGLRPA